MKPGNICFAKVRGYIPWPARINLLPGDVKIPRGKIPVFFYGTHEVSYVSENDLFDFEKYKDTYGTHKEKNSKFNDAMKEVISNPNILQLGIDKNAIKYLSRLYQFDYASAKETYLKEKDDQLIEKELEGSQEPQVQPIVQSRKRKHSTSKGPEPKKPKKMKSTDQIKPLTSPALKIHTIKDEATKINEEKPKVNEEVPILDEKPTKINEELPKINEKSEINEEPKINELTKVHEVKKIEEVPKIKQEEPKIENEVPKIEEDLKIEETNISEKDTEEKAKSIADEQSEDQTIEIRLSSLPELEIHLSDILIDGSIHTASETATFFKSPPKDIEVSQTKRNRIIKYKEEYQEYMNEITHKSHSSENEKFRNIYIKAKEEKKKKHQSSHHSKKNKQHFTPTDRTHSIPQHSKTPEISPEERDLRIVSQLSVIDKEIKRSLIVGNENYGMCKKLMLKLRDLNHLNLVLLCKVPEIVTTMRKCRRYKKDDSIKAIASEIYQRFYQIYELSDIDEKIESGAELLKRDVGSCKSAQTLMDEIFVADGKGQPRRRTIPSLSLSSPGSHPSSCANTPLLLAADGEVASLLDPVLIDINELISNGTLELIEVYDGDQEGPYPCAGKGAFLGEGDLYKRLGV